MQQTWLFFGALRAIIEGGKNAGNVFYIAICVTTISTIQFIEFLPQKYCFLGPLIFLNVKKTLLKLLFIKMAPICGPCLMSHMGLLIEPKETPQEFSPALPFWGHSDRPPQTKLGCDPPDLIYSWKQVIQTHVPN